MMVGKVCRAGVVGLLTFAAPGIADALTGSQIKCLTTIGKAGLTFVRQKPKLSPEVPERRARKSRQLCGPGRDQARQDRYRPRHVLQKTCTLASQGLAGIGFPGPCTDANPADGFTPADLVDCIRTSHDDILAKMTALQYDPTLIGPITKPQLACQQAVAKQSAGFVTCVLKAVQKCRALILKGKLPGLGAHLCATDDPKTAATISRSVARSLEDGIHDRCSDGDVAALALCTPDTTTASAAGTCLATAHTVLTDGPAIDVARGSHRLRIRGARRALWRRRREQSQRGM